MCGRDTRTHILRHGLDDEAARPLARSFAPGRCGLSGTTASGTPQSSWYPGRMHRAVGAQLFEGDFETGVTDRKNSFFLAAKEQKAESRGGAARRGAPRPARKNIIYVRHDGRLIARRFAPRPLCILILSCSDIMHADDAPKFAAISKVLSALFAFDDYPES